jgi:hypothetical protein
MQTLLRPDCIACLDHLEFKFIPNRVKMIKVLKRSKASIAPIERVCSSCLPDLNETASVHEVLRLIKESHPLRPFTMELDKSKQPTLVTAGGKITCRRCQAMSKRTGKQCGAPADRHSKSSKCKWHGSRSTGPSTPEGRAKCSEVKLTHGRETRAKRAKRSKKSAEFQQIVALGNALNLFHGEVKLRGRPPNGVGRKKVPQI